MEKENIRKIKTFSKALRLPYITRNIEEELEEAIYKELSYDKFLLEILTKENDIRHENGKANRIRTANFPYKKHLEDLKRDFLPKDAFKKLQVLETMDFIKNNQNVILIGSPGTGKTHISIGLGIKACNMGYKVLFTSVPTLINQLKETRSQKSLLTLENKFEKYDLIIADELGYISFDKEGSELLFSHLSLRSERKSTIITTNLSFDRWNEIFKDSVMTNAIIDRLTHKSYVVDMTGNSYRMEETKKWLTKNN